MTLPTAALGAPKASEFIIMLPEGQAGLLPRNVRGDQTLRQQALSTDKQLVTSLTPDRVAALRLQGFVLHANHPIRVPKPVAPVEEIALSAVTPGLKLTVPTHGADKLHAMGIKGRGVTVCVIDTGIANHGDLGGRIKKFYDVFDKREEAPNDRHGHGTHCAGIVGAAGGVLGMAPECDFIGIKVLKDNGEGSWASIMAGIDKAVEYFKAGHNPMTVSMSLGGGVRNIKDDPVVKKVQEAIALGIQFSIAAGNAGPFEDSVGSPATAPDAIAVAALNTRGTVGHDDDVIASFSSRGGDSVRYGQVGKPDIAANGVNVLSLEGRDGYARLSGTSMACPAVAGAVALLQGMANDLAAQGRLTVAVNDIDYAALIYQTAYDRPDVPEADEGNGILRVDRAAELLAKTYAIPATRDARESSFVPPSLSAAQVAASQIALAAGTTDALRAVEAPHRGRRLLAFVRHIA